MFTIGYAVYLFVLATILALLEIQIEGKDGWAKNLPCWRPKDKDSFAVRAYMFFMSGRELTGYHIAMFTLVLLVLHLPFFAGVKWDGQKELWTVSVYFLISVTWDFLWHVWNPHYGIRNSTPQTLLNDYIWWGPIPKDYFVGIAVSVGLALLGGVSLHWLTLFLTFGGLTLMSCIISLALIKK